MVPVFPVMPVKQPQKNLGAIANILSQAPELPEEAPDEQVDDEEQPFFTPKETPNKPPAAAPTSTPFQTIAALKNVRSTGNLLANGDNVFASQQQQQNKPPMFAQQQQQSNGWNNQGPIASGAGGPDKIEAVNVTNTRSALNVNINLPSSFGSLLTSVNKSVGGALTSIFNTQQQTQQSQQQQQQQRFPGPQFQQQYRPMGQPPAMFNGNNSTSSMAVRGNAFSQPAPPYSSVVQNNHIGSAWPTSTNQDAVLASKPTNRVQSPAPSIQSPPPDMSRENSADLLRTSPTMSRSRSISPCGSQGTTREGSGYDTRDNDSGLRNYHPGIIDLLIGVYYSLDRLFSIHLQSATLISILLSVS